MRVTRSSCIPRMQKPKPVSKPEQARAASPEQDRFVPASGGAEDVPGLPAPVAYGTASLDLGEKITCFTALLSQDQAYMNSPCRDFFENPTGRRLASALILADPDTQAEIAEEIGRAQTPPDTSGIDVKAMLQSGSPQAEERVLTSYKSVLARRACSTGLTDTERLLGARLERMEQTARGSFHQRMLPVLKAIEKGFSDAGLSFDCKKSYSFRLNTPEFTFSVSGGTDRENALIEQVINTSQLKTAVSAFCGHWKEGRTTNPRMAESASGTQAESFEAPEIPPEISANMKKLKAAYERSRIDQVLKKRYGFGVDDIECAEGAVTGKMNTVSEAIEQDRSGFMKTVGDAFVLMQERYLGNPEFPGDIFSLENGKFCILYGRLEGSDSVIQGVERKATPGLQPTAASVVSRGADFRAMMENAAKASAPMEEASGTAKVPPLPDFSKMSDQQKLEAIRELHDQTDYSGMTNTEKYGLIISRIEKAFPTFMAMQAGLYGPMVVTVHYGSGPNEYTEDQIDTIPQKLWAERERQLKDANVILPKPSKGSEFRREALYPGMSDREIYNTLCKKYKGKSLANTVSMGHELMALDLDLPEAKELVNAHRVMLDVMNDSLGVDENGRLSKLNGSMSLDELLETYWGAALDAFSNSWAKTVDELLEELIK